jgi:UDP-N-acetylmuramate--alanine ligase
MKEFSTAFGDATTVEILDIYAASEEPIEGISGQTLAQVIECAEYAASTDEAIERVVSRAGEGDVIITQGAGSVSGIALGVLAALA